jgi:hypothetical protein
MWGYPMKYGRMAGVELSPAPDVLRQNRSGRGLIRPAARSSVQDPTVLVLVGRRRSGVLRPDLVYEFDKSRPDV